MVLKNHIHLTELVPCGFVFLWIRHDMLYEIILTMESLRFQRVDSIMWVKKHVNNRISQQPSKYFNKSMEKCHIFRRTNEKKQWYKQDMRHQRSSDVYEGFMRFKKDGVMLRPNEYIQSVVETMLPPSANRKYLMMYV